MMSVAHPHDLSSMLPCRGRARYQSSLIRVAPAGRAERGAADAWPGGRPGGSGASAFKEEKKFVTSRVGVTEQGRCQVVLGRGHTSNVRATIRMPAQSGSAVTCGFRESRLRESNPGPTHYEAVRSLGDQLASCPSQPDSRWSPRVVQCLGWQSGDTSGTSGSSYSLRRLEHSVGAESADISARHRDAGRLGIRHSAVKARRGGTRVARHLNTCRFMRMCPGICRVVSSCASTSRILAANRSALASSVVVAACSWTRWRS